MIPDLIQDSIEKFIMDYRIVPNRVLITPKAHRQLKDELGTKVPISEILKLKVIVVSSDIDIQIALVRD